MDPKAIQYIPKNTFFDMPDLFNKIINEEKLATAFPLREYWMDIGRLDDYEKANKEFSGVF
nr:sugar phosphate nucleotidyltransferase [Heyndrickxia oleronia]